MVKIITVATPPPPGLEGRGERREKAAVRAGLPRPSTRARSDAMQWRICPEPALKEPSNAMTTRENHRASLQLFSTQTHGLHGRIYTCTWWIQWYGHIVKDACVRCFLLGLLALGGASHLQAWQQLVDSF